MNLCLLLMSANVVVWFVVVLGIDFGLCSITNPNMEWIKLEIATFKFGDQKTVG